MSISTFENYIICKLCGYCNARLHFRTPLAKLIILLRIHLVCHSAFFREGSSNNVLVQIHGTNAHAPGFHTVFAKSWVWITRNCTQVDIDTLPLKPYKSEFLRGKFSHPTKLSVIEYSASVSIALTQSNSLIAFCKFGEFDVISRFSNYELLYI